MHGLVCSVLIHSHMHLGQYLVPLLDVRKMTKLVQVLGL